MPLYVNRLDSRWRFSKIRGYEVAWKEEKEAFTFLFWFSVKRICYAINEEPPLNFFCVTYSVVHHQKYVFKGTESLSLKLVSAFYQMSAPCWALDCILSFINLPWVIKGQKQFWTIQFFSKDLVLACMNAYMYTHTHREFIKLFFFKRKWCSHWVREFENPAAREKIWKQLVDSQIMMYLSLIHPVLHVYWKDWCWS